MTHWRQKPKPKAPRLLADILWERNERRTAALAACVNEMSSGRNPDTLTHALVAERAGVPLQYVRWKYPSREHLIALADAWSRGKREQQSALAGRRA